MPLGSLSELKQTDEEVNELVSKIKKDFEESNYKTNKFKALNYKIQIVNGTNFFIKIETDKEHVHLRVYKSLSGELDYNSSKLNKKMDDEIIYF